MPEAGLPMEWFKQSMWASFFRPEDTHLREWQVGGNIGGWKRWKHWTEAGSPQTGDSIYLLTPREPQAKEQS